jgi:stage IV sporulation protein FA
MIKQEAHEQLLMEDPEYYWHHQGNPWKKTSASIGHRLRLQILFSMILFILIWLLFQIQSPELQRLKQWITLALSQQISYVETSQWMKDYMGDWPAIIPSFKRNDESTAALGINSPLRAFMKPATGTLIQPFNHSDSEAGVIVGVKGSRIVAIDTGLVTFVGVTPDMGNTIILRHPAGFESIYGNLQSIDVAQDDWVEAGERIGSVRVERQSNKGTLFFAMKQHDRFINPADVIAF